VTEYRRVRWLEVIRAAARDGRWAAELGRGPDANPYTRADQRAAWHTAFTEKRLAMIRAARPEQEKAK